MLPSCVPSVSLGLSRAGSLLGCSILLLLLAVGGRVMAGLILQWAVCSRRSVPVEICLGYGIGALAWLGIGLAGLWFRGIAGVLLGIPAIAALWKLHPRKILPAGIPNRLWLLAVPPLLFTLAGALAPETAFDPLRCHLGLAKIFQQAHKIYLPENLSFASYPLNASMLFGWLRLLGGDSAAKLFNWHLLPMLGVLTSILAGGGIWGAAAGVALFTVPVVWLQSSKAFAELLMACFAACALVSFQGEGGRRKSAVLSGLFLGLALGTKYTAVNAILPMLLLLGMRDGSAGLRLAAGGLCAAAVPWLARNYLGEGNPVHPLFSWYFSSPEGVSAALARPVPPVAGFLKGGFLSLMALPWRLFMTGSFADTYPLGPAVLVFLPFLAIARGRSPALAVYSLVYLLAWAGLTGGLGRYIVAGLPALLAAAVPALLPAFRGWMIWAASLAVFLPCVMLGAQSVAVRQDPVPFAAGCVDRGEYLARRIPENLRIMGLVSGSLRESERFYSYGELVTYYARPEGVSEFEEDRPLIRRLAAGSADAGAMERKFRQRRITAILYNQSGGMTQTAVSGAGPWSARDLMVWQEFLRTRTDLLARWEEPGANICVTLFGLTNHPNTKGRLKAGVIWPHLPAGEGILDEGDGAMKKGDFRRARRFYREAAARYPGYAWAWQRMAESWKALGRSADAEKCMARAKKLGMEGIKEARK